MKHYDISLEKIVFAERKPKSKAELSNQRLLRQPTAYEVLTLVWSDPPYSVSSRDDFDNWDDLHSVYSIAKSIAGDDRSLGKVVNYVTRVVPSRMLLEFG